MIINFNQYLKENNNSEYDYLISLLNKIKNDSYSFDNFKTIIEYYGVRNEEMVDVKYLINTERVSGREVKTTGLINVVKDIRNGKMYIIDGHNRTQQAKNNNQEKISAVVSKGYFDKKGSYFDPEVNILAQKYNINLEDFYNDKLTESLLDKLQGPTKEDVLKNYKIDGNIDTVESLLDYIIKNSNKKMYDSTRHENAFVYYFLNRKNMFIVNIYENECLITKILSDLLNIFNVSKEEKIKKVKDYLYQHDIITDICKVKINY